MPKIIYHIWIAEKVLLASEFNDGKGVQVRPDNPEGKYQTQDIVHIGLRIDLFNLNEGPYFNLEMGNRPYRVYIFGGKVEKAAKD